jgi:hypothetical protein
VGILNRNVVDCLNKKYGIGAPAEVVKQANTQDATFTEKTLRTFDKQPNNKRGIKDLNKDLKLLILLMSVEEDKVMV